MGDCVGQGVGGGQPLLGQAHEVNRPKLFKTLILPFTQREHTRLSAVLSPFEYLPSGQFWHTLSEDVWPPSGTSAQYSPLRQPTPVHPSAVRELVNWPMPHWTQGAACGATPLLLRADCILLPGQQLLPVLLQAGVGDGVGLGVGRKP